MNPEGREDMGTTEAETSGETVPHGAEAPDGDDLCEGWDE